MIHMTPPMARPLSPSALWEFKRRRRLTGKQMRVTRQRERWRVVSERSAQLHDVRPAAQVQRCEGVPKRVKARPRSADLLDQGLEDAPPEVVGIDRLSNTVGKDQGG
jgi:hypothetical protein